MRLRIVSVQHVVVPIAVVCVIPFAGVVAPKTKRDSFNSLFFSPLIGTHNTRKTIKRFLYGFFKGHALLTGTSKNSVGVDSVPFHMTRLAISYTVNSEKLGRRGVSYLLGLVSPSTVLGSVVTVIVNSVNRVFGGWLKPHVFDKIAEPNTFFKPPVTNFNAPTAVIIVVIVLGVVTTLSHSFVAIVLLWVIACCYCHYLYFSIPLQVSEWQEYNRESD